MTVPLSPTSPRREHARRYGAALRAAMTERGIGTKTLAPQVGCATSAIAAWRAGQNLPTIKSALRMSEALQAPILLEIARDARSGVCPACGKSWINEGGTPKIYCDERCRNRASIDRARGYVEEPDIALVKEIERLTREPGPMRKVEVRAATDAFRATRNKSRRIIQARELDRHMGAVEAFCRSCEWDGFCKMPDCELRSVSPLPLEPNLELPDPAQPAEGAWGPGNRDRMVAAIRGANSKRWSRPGERERAAKRSARWWEGMTPLKRREIAAKMSERRKGHPTYRACGCPNRAHRKDCLIRGEAA